MNSLNHYAYGSITEWMYQSLVGIRPLASFLDGIEDTPEEIRESAGYRRFQIAPGPGWQLPEVSGSFRSPSGLIESACRIDGEMLHVCVTVPFDTECILYLPGGKADELFEADGKEILEKRQEGGSVRVLLDAGTYRFVYRSLQPLRQVYSLDSPVQELMDHPETKKILDQCFFSVHHALPFFGELFTLREVLNSPFLNLPLETQEKMDRLLMEA